MFEIELRYSIEMTSFKIYKFFEYFILYVMLYAYIKKLHSNLTIFAWNAYNMPIAWLIFHDFGIIVIVLVHKKKKIEPNSIKAKVVILFFKLMAFQKSVQWVPPLGYWKKLIKTSL